MSLGNILLVLTGYVLTVASLTRLVNYDRIFDKVRLWPARRASVAATAAREAEANNMPTEHVAAVRRYQRWVTLSDFLACPWCVSPWIAAPCAPVPIQVIGWPLWTLIPLVLATRYLVGIADRWVSEPYEIVDQA